MATSLVALAFAAEVPLATKGELLLEEDFRATTEYTRTPTFVKPGWKVRVVQGDWTRTAEGVCCEPTRGAARPALVYDGAFDDVVVEIEFRYREEAGRPAGLRLSVTNESFVPRGHAVSTWANTSVRARPAGLVLEHDESAAARVTQVMRLRNEFKPEAWHVLRLEVIGDQAQATCGGVTVRGAHEKFAVPKSSLWIEAGECSYELRRLRVYRATAAPDGKPAESKTVPPNSASKS